MWIRQQPHDPNEWVVFDGQTFAFFWDKQQAFDYYNTLKGLLTND